ncbi:STM4014 family protein [Paenibacillus sp. GSMTC-2017]|uniref:STM4014 family protein n=1 Tax=Paenibacillus sp. GSMTC-2017 TaxID=2794350 RepID=UPI0018D96E3C|nr:STM4014 family protein [Paenibacillus sp. GSMTC-2017]MBH5319321.1 STM4014 family protein [Paenibacillus sp. GSMTC-2017]
MNEMILIGNGGNRRTMGLQSAKLKLGLPPALELNYIDLLQGNSSLTSFIDAHNVDKSSKPLLRLDAPGENFEVERMLIANGAPDALNYDDDLSPSYGVKYPQPISRKNALIMHEQRGRLYHPSQWFRGYKRLLAQLSREAKGLWEEPNWMNAPQDIAIMFDKRATYNVLSSAGIPMPRRLGEPEAITDYDVLRELMKTRRMPRIFLKQASGSGACGVMAYQINPQTGAEIAITTIGVENYMAKPPLYYNVKRLQRYTDRSTIRQIINWLLSHGAHAEQWVAKASFQERVFDIRQLVVNGSSCHSVARVSSTPITNLHLQSTRMSFDDVGLSQEAQIGIRQCAERTLQAFPKSSVAGIDIALSAGAGQPYVLDVNPFGDLLYEVSYEGYNTYEWEMKQIAAQQKAIGKREIVQ